MKKLSIILLAVLLSVSITCIANAAMPNYQIAYEGGGGGGGGGDGFSTLSISDAEFFSIPGDSPNISNIDAIATKEIDNAHITFFNEELTITVPKEPSSAFIGSEISFDNYGEFESLATWVEVNGSGGKIAIYNVDTSEKIMLSDYSFGAPSSSGHFLTFKALNNPDANLAYCYFSAIPEGTCFPQYVNVANGDVINHPIAGYSEYGMSQNNVVYTHNGRINMFQVDGFGQDIVLTSPEASIGMYHYDWDGKTLAWMDTRRGSARSDIYYCEYNEAPPGEDNCIEKQLTNSEFVKDANPQVFGSLIVFERTHIEGGNSWITAVDLGLGEAFAGNVSHPDYPISSNPTISYDGKIAWEWASVNSFYY